LLLEASPQRTDMLELLIAVGTIFDEVGQPAIGRRDELGKAAWNGGCGQQCWRAG